VGLQPAEDLQALREERSFNPYVGGTSKRRTKIMSHRDVSEAFDLLVGEIEAVLNDVREQAVNRCGKVKLFSRGFET